MARDVKSTDDVPGYTPATLAVKDEFRQARRPKARFPFGDMMVEVAPGRDTVWVIIRRAGKGAIALRTIPWAGPYKISSGRKHQGANVWVIETTSGRWTVSLSLLSDTSLRLTMTVTPVADLLLTFWPRDLYPLDNDGDPTGARGCVEAGQRGFNSGLCYFTFDAPGFGTVLYLQNLSALNAYFIATETKPDGVVGGEWPELGYQPPTAPMGNSPPEHPLRAGVEVTISDALVAFRPETDRDEVAVARRFIDMLADLYPWIDKPEGDFHDWIERSERTISDLKTAPDARVSAYGHTYLHPYVGAEYPDSMVQLSVLASLHEYEIQRGKADDLSQELAAGLHRFYDRDLSVLRRYLPNVGEDKNADASDSWYLYHPLMNLARLAQVGDAASHKLFFEAIGFGIRVAHHFKYVWPVQFDIRDFSVITQSRSPQGRGQTDVGGLYAYVMIQAHELSGEPRYLDEAKTALTALRGTRFNLAYQTNITAWGAVACLKLWRLGEGEGYRDLSTLFVAGILHNCELWQSRLGCATDYKNFFGLTCLHDGPYMAAYECFEVFAAFDDYLRIGGTDIEDSVRLMVGEFRKYALDSTWYFYPDALPEAAVATDNIRNGHIDRKLSFPREDLYGDGRPAGTVGQEIYGCGGAFLFANRAFHDAPDLPFRVFCDLPADFKYAADGHLVVTLLGLPRQSARVRVIKKPRRRLPRLTALIGEAHIKAKARAADFRDYAVPGDAVLTFTYRTGSPEA